MRTAITLRTTRNGIQDMEFHSTVTETFLRLQHIEQHLLDHQQDQQQPQLEQQREEAGPGVGLQHQSQSLPGKCKSNF